MLTRRALLPAAGALVGGALGLLWRAGRAARREGPGAFADPDAPPTLEELRDEAPLRPPGALPEDDFLAACIRCGQCVEACPYGTLALAPLGAGLAAGAPRVDSRAKACHLCQGHDELLCIPACPTRALRPVEDWRAVEMGVALIDRDRCLAWNRASCRACWHACPFPNEAIVLDWRARARIAADACIGCGICDEVCLTDPSAIVIRPRAALRPGDPTHVGEGTT